MKPTHLLLTVAALILSSCVGTMTHEVDPTTGAQKTDATVALGGMGSKGKTTTYAANGDKIVTEFFTYDNQQSFKDATKVPIAKYQWQGAVGVTKEVGDSAKILTD